MDSARSLEVREQLVLHMLKASIAVMINQTVKHIQTATWKINAMDCQKRPTDLNSWTLLAVVEEMAASLSNVACIMHYWRCLWTK